MVSKRLDQTTTVILEYGENLFVLMVWRVARRGPKSAQWLVTICQNDLKLDLPDWSVSQTNIYNEHMIAAWYIEAPNISKLSQDLIIDLNVLEHFGETGSVLFKGSLEQARWHGISIVKYGAKCDHDETSWNSNA